MYFASVLYEYVYIALQFLEAGKVPLGAEGFYDWKDHIYIFKLLTHMSVLVRLKKKLRSNAIYRFHFLPRSPMQRKGT